MTTLTALLIEDDELTAEMVASALAMGGFEVTTVYSGKNGIAALTERAFHLIIVDLHLPDIGGPELLRVLRSSPHGAVTKILAVTSSEDEKELAAALRTGGADDIYQKTIGRDVLIAKFESLAHKFKAEARVACRLQIHEDRIEALVQDMDTCSRDKDAKIDDLRVLLQGIKDDIAAIKVDTANVREIVTAWNQTKAMVTGIKVAAAAINRTKWVWAPIVAFIVWLKTGEWKWPQH